MLPWNSFLKFELILILNWQEISKWLYVLVISIFLFLFFCLLLDGFCFLAFGGWQPLLGKWPIFSGTVSIAFYGSPLLLAVLVFGLAGVSRLILGDDVPGLFKSDQNKIVQFEQDRTNFEEE